MEQRKARIFLLMALLFAGLVGTTAYHKENGLADIIELNRAIAELDGKIATLEAENGQLDRLRTTSLSNDALVEKIAREDLGLARPGEVVYEFRPLSSLALPPSPAGRAPKGAHERAL